MPASEHSLVQHTVGQAMAVTSLLTAGIAFSLAPCLAAQTGKPLSECTAIMDPPYFNLGC